MARFPREPASFLSTPDFGVRFEGASDRIIKFMSYNMNKVLIVSLAASVSGFLSCMLTCYKSKF